MLPLKGKFEDHGPLCPTCQKMLAYLEDVLFEEIPPVKPDVPPCSCDA